MSAFLEVEGITKRYGENRVLRGVSLFGAPAQRGQSGR